MKKISLLVVLASIYLAISPAKAQSPDTTKNKVEIKKKTKVGVNGRQVTKIKMETKGTPEAVTEAVESAVTGKAKPTTPTAPANPNVVVVEREPVTKVVTVPVPVEVKKPTVTARRTTTTTVNTRRVPKTAVKRTTTTKPIASSSTKTTTTVSTN